jgi:two-component system nitrate/nitrite response regulator NarP
MLSKREQEIIKYAAYGLSNVQIAAVLKISVNTVKFHVSNILQKLEASNRAEACSKYVTSKFNQ